MDDNQVHTVIKEMEGSGPGEEKCPVLTGTESLAPELAQPHMVIPQCLDILAGEPLKCASLSPGNRVRLYLNK